ncbi:DUF4142 domain-containing protein [Sphingomonas sp.]|uniref:DUF4142 domain-containing protein n=1 Tax=Sphingomonas sp. TaxID=28214 RepID=UPI003B00894F
MPILTRSIAAIALATAALAAPALAQSAAPDTQTYLMKAGASDKFEITEAKLMKASKNPQIKQFATQMITDHTKSTMMVKKAAMADHKTVKPAMLDADQKQQVAQLTAAKGTERDSLYIQQQKPAHQQALDLQQSYASGGADQHLKDNAGQIVPVVQSHIDMLNQMPAM